MRRVAVVYDGFNFYYGMRKLREATGVCYYWQDLHQLSDWLLAERPGAEPSDSLVHVVYFTANIKSGDHRKIWRQQNYFQLFEALGNVKIVRGEYVIRPLRCHTCDTEPAICIGCGATMEKHQEKQTDVNLALWAIIAAYKDWFDDLIIVTSDSDLAKVAYQVRKQFPTKRAYYAFPPEQVQNTSLINESDGWMTISEDMLRSCVLRRRLKIGGQTFGCPREWLQGGVVPN